jgi:hypothetical protein
MDRSEYGIGAWELRCRGRALGTVEMGGNEGLVLSGYSMRVCKVGSATREGVGGVWCYCKAMWLVEMVTERKQTMNVYTSNEGMIVGCGSPRRFVSRNLLRI